MANKRQRIWAVVAARMGSDRLPGKSMALLASMPSLAHIVHRLRRSAYLDGVTVATTTAAEDDIIRELGRHEGIPVFSGSAEDVLERTLRAALAVHADVIVQVTGDCPLMDPGICDDVISAYLERGPDYASNVHPPTYPNGMDTEVFATEVLARVAQLTADPADREHVTLYIYERPDEYQLLNVTAPSDQTWPELRLTLDTREDYALISSVFDALYPVDDCFGLPSILAYLRSHPDLLGLNKRVRQKPAR